MPFKSQAQARWAHSKEGMDALGGPAKVKEWADATDMSHLPERAPQSHKPKKKERPKPRRSSGVRWV